MTGQQMDYADCADEFANGSPTGEFVNLLIGKVSQ